MKVLFIAYNFPPCGGPGVQRSIKFIKYLLRSGEWDPVVITTYENVYGVRDASLLKDVPDTLPVYRASSMDVNSYRSSFTSVGLGKIHGLINTLVALPDSAVFWSYFARKRVKQAINEHKPDIVYTTSGPFSAHLLGLWIKRQYGLPWVADFRDPWSMNRFVKYPPGYRKINAWLESKVLRKADKILCVSELDAANFIKLAPASADVSVIHNGYDEDDFPSFGTVNLANIDKFTITYTGNFSSTRRPDAIVKAVRALIDTGMIGQHEINLVFAGSNLERFLPNEPFISNVGYVPHAQLKKIRDESHMMLLLQDTSEETIGDYSGKIFEYLASGKPILAISNPRSVAVKLIEHTRTGYTATDNVTEVIDVLKNCFLKWKAGSFTFDPDWHAIRQFSRTTAAEKLATIFNGMTKDGRSHNL